MIEETKLKITVDYSLKELKEMYRRFFGNHKRVTKQDIASWLGDLASADIQDYTVNEDLDDDE